MFNEKNGSVWIHKEFALYRVAHKSRPEFGVELKNT